MEAQISAGQLAYLDWEQSVSLEDMIESLPEGTVFIDYCVFEKARSQTADVANQALLASVLQHDGSIAMHDLGPIAPVEAAIDQWRSTFGEGGSGIEAGSKLREMLIAPLGDVVVTAKKNHCLTRWRAWTTSLSRTAWQKLGTVFDRGLRGSQRCRSTIAAGNVA